MVEKVGEGLIVSYHDVEGTPDDLDGLYSEMTDVGADIVKIVVTPQLDRGRRAPARVRGARARTTAARPLIALALGPLGTLTRVLAGRYGAPFTFASAAGGAESAPGQLPAAVMADLYRVRNVTAETKVYGVLGQSVLRSLSPVLHNRAFEARGLDAVYVPLQAEALPPFIEALPALGLSGFSVTRPYKVEILPYLQEVEEPAALCGSVNTVVVHDGMLRGSTTDGTGVLVPLKKKIDVKGRNVVILGAGGAARAAALALLRKGAHVTLLARDPDKAAEVAAALGCGAGALHEASPVPVGHPHQRDAGGVGAHRPTRPRCPPSCTARARSSSTWSTTRWRRASCARRRRPAARPSTACRCCWRRPSRSSRPGRAWRRRWTP